MSKRQAKFQASSARAATTSFGGFGASSPAVFGTGASQLAYVSEPPDLSGVSDPNVVVLFRNLSKRDSTTKAKALEELQAHVASLQTPIEDAVVEAWVKMYPRTSIDNAKAVRQSAHTLMGQIAASAGKRIAPRMPTVVAPWLCGLYDSDRAVMQDTVGSLRKVFNSDEKIKSIRTAYQKPILEYCRDAIDKESALTLSDERSVSPDDAAAKYSRVISGCISLLGSLLSNLKSEELSKYQTEYDGLLGDKKIWDLASHSDASIRRAVHRFIQTCVEKQPKIIGEHLETLSKAYLSGALNSDQTGSAGDYIVALCLLTTKYPTLWTEHYKSKTSVERRLRQFLKKGSQFASKDFWDRLVHLFKALPKDVMPKNAADAAELLGALHGGINRKEELKNNDQSRGAYLQIANLISQDLPENDRPTLLKELVLPYVSQYLRPSTPLDAEWEVRSSATVAKAIAVAGMPDVVQEAWPQYAQSLVDEMKTSAPQQSQEYKKSQDSIVLKAGRLAALQQDVLKLEGSASLRSTFAGTCASIVTAAIGVVKNRNGKPYGAAVAVTQLLAKNNPLLIENGELKQELEKFLQEDIPNLVISPSGPYLVDILYLMADTSVFQAAWDSTLKAALAAEDSPAKTAAVDALITSPKIPSSLDGTSTAPELMDYLNSRLQGALQGSEEWVSITGVLQSPSNVVPSSTADAMLSTMTASLSLSEQAPNALRGLRQIVKQNPAMLKDFVVSPRGSALLQSLLLVSEMPDEELAQEAAAVNASVQTLLGAGSTSKQSMVDVIRQGLRDASPTSVSVETLVDLATQLVKPSDSDGPDKIMAVLPDFDEWDKALAPFLATAPRPSLAITSPLNGTVYIVQQGAPHSRNEHLPRDGDGYSPAYRIAQYAVKLLNDIERFPIDKVPVEVKRRILDNTLVTALLVNDNLGLAGANNMWAIYTLAVEDEATTFLSEAHEVVTRLKEQLVALGAFDPISEWLTELSSRGEADTSSQAFYSQSVRVAAVLDWIEQRGHREVPIVEIGEIIKSLRKDRDNIALTAVLTALREPLWIAKSCVRMCNEFVADLTGIKIDSRAEEGLRQLILLNTILYGQPEITETIAKQRIVFFVKHVAPWLQVLELSTAVRAETCRALAALLPAMSDMYGEHWGEIIGALAASWQNTTDLDASDIGKDSLIAYTHASLKLYAQLRSLTQLEDPNDDLLDAWKSTEQDVARGLTNLLNHSQHFPDDFHQPLKIVNELLGRQLAKVPLKHFEATEELFPLLYVESQPVQQSAFDILHKKIPAAQEQISIDAALEKTTARLPEELLSLILEAPTVEALGDASFERSMPLPLRGYLLSWVLVFDHLDHASFKVKNDYIDHLKEGDYLPGLLSFMFDFLGHSRSKPVDVSKFDVTTWDPDAFPPMQDTQWLLTYLYYLCLRHIPSMTRTWWKDCGSRPITVTLESWTEKYVSPPVIAAALDSVAQWAREQEQAEPDSPFSVRINARGREITASYLVDEQTMSIRITLPAAFPLATATIEPLHRVALSQQKWNAMIRTSAGAITIFNASLIDALSTFRRNVDGALKGQTECAICYSIVGPDRKLPSKRCGTCKHLFHSGCLHKWFRSSGQSSCPLCRNQFNYG